MFLQYVIRRKNKVIVAVILKVIEVNTKILIRNKTSRHPDPPNPDTQRFSGLYFVSFQKDLWSHIDWIRCSDFLLFSNQIVLFRVPPFKSFRLHGSGSGLRILTLNWTKGKQLHYRASERLDLMRSADLWIYELLGGIPMNYSRFELNHPVSSGSPRPLLLWIA